MAKRKKPKSYEEALATLPPAKRTKVNEAMASAVTKLTDTAGQGMPGTKLFLEARGMQLVHDFRFMGWSPAANRFRAAVAQWAKHHPLEA